ALYLVPGFLEPLGDGAFKDRFTHLRHDNIYAGAAIAARSGLCREGFLGHRGLLRSRNTIGLGRGSSRGCGRLSRLWSGRRGHGGAALGVDHTYHGVDLHRGSLGDFDLFENARCWSGNLSINFVGGDLKKRLVTLDFITRLLEPLGDSAFENRLAYLGHDYVSWHGTLPLDVNRLVSN